MIIALMISAIMFCGLTYLIEISDPESKMHIFSKEQLFFILIIMYLQSYIVTTRFTSLLDISFFSSFLTILLMHAHTDMNTKYVYRLFSYIMWFLGIIYSILKICVLHEIPQNDLFMFLAGTVLFIVIMLLGSVFTGFIHGKGDGYILIGCSLFLQFTAYGQPKIGVEPILWLYIFSVLFLITFNFKKVSFRKKRMKERVPFAPSIYAGTLIVTLLTGIDAITNALINLAI